MIFIIVFVITLLVLSLFFALKEREEYTGHLFPWTRLAISVSPRAEKWFRRKIKYVEITLKHAVHVLYLAILHFFEYVFFWLKRIILRLASWSMRMITGRRFSREKPSSAKYLEKVRKHKEDLIQQEMEEE